MYIYSMCVAVSHMVLSEGTCMLKNVMLADIDDICRIPPFVNYVTGVGTFETVFLVFRFLAFGLTAVSLPR